MSHAEFLRNAWPGADDDCLRFVRQLWRYGSNQDHNRPIEERILDVADLLPKGNEQERAIMRLTARLAIAPASMTAARVNTLCQTGLDDGMIHDAINVASLFAFMNRFADGNGVKIDHERQAFAIELFGESALEPSMD